MYNFIVIDPRRPTVPANTLGIEVTIPEIAAQCDLGNIDPQHGCARAPDVLGPTGWAFSDGDAAIDLALRIHIPRDGTTLATIRPDLDAFGAMAVLALRAAGLPVKGDGHPAHDAADSFAKRGALARAKSVAEADGNAATSWAPRALPTVANPWPVGVAVDSRRELAAIAAVVADHDRPVSFRVACMAAWLLGGETPERDACHLAAKACGLAFDYEVMGPDTEEAIQIALRDARARVEGERADMNAALSDGRIQIEVRDDIAVVHSAHRAATMLGQCVAPVAVCFHPAFRWPSGAVTPKATIAWAVAPAIETMAAIKDRLNWLECERTAEHLGLAWSNAGWADSPIEREAQNLARSAAHRDMDLSVLRRLVSELPATEPGVDPLADETRSVLAILASGGGWGGNLRSGIIGSPQGRKSALSEADVLACVQSHA